jgi:hypothetical protein
MVNKMRNVSVFLVSLLAVAALSACDLFFPSAPVDGSGVVVEEGTGVDVEVPVAPPVVEPVVPVDSDVVPVEGSVVPVPSEGTGVVVEGSVPVPVDVVPMEGSVVVPVDSEEVVVP